jgi:hypothetical protein
MIELAIVAMLATAGRAILEPQPNGLQFTLRIEAGSVNGAPPTALPAGAAEMDVITDGQSVRATLHGQIGSMADGVVSLTPAGAGVWYKIDPHSKTYEVRPVTSPRAKVGESARVSSTAITEVIEGHLTRKFVVSSKGPASTGAETSRRPTDAEPVELLLWCTSELSVPPRITEMTNVALGYLDEGTARQFARTCPMALRSVTRASDRPGMEVVRQVTSIRRASPASELFKLPLGYRLVQ